MSDTCATKPNHYRLKLPTGDFIVQGACLHRIQGGLEVHGSDGKPTAIIFENGYGAALMPGPPKEDC